MERNLLKTSVQGTDWPSRDGSHPSGLTALALAAQRRSLCSPTLLDGQSGGPIGQKAS